MAKKEQKKTDQNNESEIDVAENTDSFTSSSYNRSEIQFSYGYGFGKGAPPSSSYDEIVTDGPNSNRQISNVEDKYLSLGEGMRFEARYLYFFKETFGAFVEIGYSYGHLDEKVSYKYVSYGSPLSYSMVEKVSFRFYTVPIVAGVHFRLPSNIFSPFGGIGIGIWLPSKQTIDFSREFNTTRYEGIQENEMNTPLGFTSYLGFTVNLKPDINFFVQAKTSMATYYVQRSEITKYTRDGTDDLQSLSVRNKITVYETNKNYTENPEFDPASPRHGGAPYPVPASTVSIVAGLVFAL